MSLSSLDIQKTSKNCKVHLWYFDFKQKREKMFTVALGGCGRNFCCNRQYVGHPILNISVSSNLSVLASLESIPWLKKKMMLSLILALQSPELGDIVNLDLHLDQIQKFLGRLWESKFCYDRDVCWGRSLNSHQKATLNENEFAWHLLVCLDLQNVLG